MVDITDEMLAEARQCSPETAACYDLILKEALSSPMKMASAVFHMSMVLGAIIAANARSHSHLLDGIDMAHKAVRKSTTNIFVELEKAHAAAEKARSK